MKTAKYLIILIILSAIAGIIDGMLLNAGINCSSYIYITLGMICQLVYIHIFYNLELKDDKDKEKLKKYKYEITYKNKQVLTGDLTANNLEEAKEILLDNKYTICNNSKRLVYNNSNEIQTCLINEVEEKL